MAEEFLQSLSLRLLGRNDRLNQIEEQTRCQITLRANANEVKGLNTQTQSPLCRLPPKLKHLIYEDVFTSGDFKLLYTCRVIWLETHGLALHLHAFTFRFTNSHERRSKKRAIKHFAAQQERMQKFFGSLTPRNRLEVNTVRLPLSQHDLLNLVGTNEMLKFFGVGGKPRCSSLVKKYDHDAQKKIWRQQAKEGKRAKGFHRMVVAHVTMSTGFTEMGQHSIARPVSEKDRSGMQPSPMADGTSATLNASQSRYSELVNARYSIILSTGKRLVLFRLPTLASTATQANNSIDGWTYYAMEAECPHAGGPMGEALVDIEDSSYIASCPWHAYDFNLDSGESSYGVKACTFPVLVQGNELVLQLINADDDVSMVSFDPISEKVKFKHGARSTNKDGEDSTTHRNPSLPGDNATLSDRCVCILNTTDPELKIERTTQVFAAFATREQSSKPMPIGGGTILPPDEPPREAQLHQVKPWEMPNPGRGGTVKSRVAMLHALANIEQWAIDLAIDICVRFASFQTTSSHPIHLPRIFYYDWLKVANDEAKHFSLLRSRLEDLGSHFGALPVHHGLWESAALTSNDLRARISVIALVHEARGLDVNPMTIEKFRKAGDGESVETLEIIHNDEITHVTTGHRWLSWICEQEGTDPVQVFRSNVMKHFKGAVKGPFNAEARLQAGMDASYYENLGGAPWKAHVIAGG